MLEQLAEFQHISLPARPAKVVRRSHVTMRTFFIDMGYSQLSPKLNSLNIPEYWAMESKLLALTPMMNSCVHWRMTMEEAGAQAAPKKGVVKPKHASPVELLQRYKTKGQFYSETFRHGTCCARWCGPPVVTRSPRSRLSIGAPHNAGDFFLNVNLSQSCRICSLLQRRK